MMISSLGCATTHIDYDYKKDHVVVDHQTLFRTSNLKVDKDSIAIDHEPMSGTFSNFLSGLVGFLASKLGVPF